MLALRCMLGVTILLGAAGLAVGLMRRRWTAAERHSVWTASLVLSLLLPLLLSLEMPTAAPASMPVVVAPGAAANRTVITVRPNDAQPVNWPVLLAWLWGAGALGVAAWWLAGYARVAGMVGSARDYRRLGRVPVRICDGVRGPALAMGPVILLPAAAAQWPEERLQMVLLHEQAHVHRKDMFWRLAGTLACCLYWFHPLAWWAAAQQRRESEMASDDLVLLGGESAVAYAGELVAVARESVGLASPAAVMPMARQNELEGRLVALLDGRRPRGAGSWRVSLGALVMGLALMLPLAAWQDPSVQLQGSVRDIVGVIPGAKLILKTSTTDAGYSFTSEADGGYKVTGVPEGTYMVEIEKPGYERFRLANVTLKQGRTARLDHYLTIGRITENITVNGGSGGNGPATTASAPSRIRVSGNVQAAQLITKVNPLYPPEAKQARIQGTVHLRAVIGKEGDILTLDLLATPSAELARSAETAVKQWKYKPTLLNGNPIEVITEIHVNYTLTQ